jgi:hypothetical protein
VPFPLEVEDPDRRLIISDLPHLVSPGEAEAEEASRMTMSLHAPSPLEVEDPDRRLILSDLLRLVSPGEAGAEEALRTTISSSAPSGLEVAEEGVPGLTSSGRPQVVYPGAAGADEA